MQIIAYFFTKNALPLAYIIKKLYLCAAKNIYRYETYFN